MSTRRTALLLSGAALILLGLLSSDGWYDPIPLQRSEVPDPGALGARLFHAVVVLEGLILVWLGMRAQRATRLRPEERLSWPDSPSVTSSGGLALSLVGATALGVILRVWNLGSDLWIDEIKPLSVYAPVELIQVFISYAGPNHHLLNTILVKLAVLGLGETEQVVRLPAVLFGMATVPLLYGLAREALSARASLGTAVLLATSYYHIFFSQNARGYTGYVFFSLLATWLLCRGLRTDRPWAWIGFVLATVANFACLLTSAFVFGAHALIGAVAIVSVWRRGASARPLAKRLFGVFAIAALLSFQLYAPVLAQAYVVLSTAYAKASVGYSPVSQAFLAVLAKGLSAGLNPTLIAAGILALPIPMLGFFALTRRNWVLSISLLLPGLLHLAAAHFLALSVYPRLFILFLPYGLLVFVAGIESIAAWLSARSGRVWLAARAPVLVIGLACIASLFSLRHYYESPKQDFTNSLEFVEGLRGDDGVVIAVHLVEQGFRYYGDRRGLRQDEDYRYVRSLKLFDEVVAENEGRRVLLATTLHRVLRVEYPELAARVEEDWEVVRVFSGTLGDGDVRIWRRRDRPGDGTTRR